MSDQDDWEFAGPDDAKAEIRAAVEYLLRGAIGGARGDIVQEIIAIVRQVASGLPPEQGNPLDGRHARRMSRHVSDETFRHAGETIFQSQRSPPETNPGYQWALGQTTGFDHVGVHPQLNLPRNSQDFPVGNA